MSPEANPRTWTVPELAAGQRLDRHASEHLDEPRNQLQRWIRDGRVSVDGRVVTKASRAVAAGEDLECRIPERRVDGEMTPEDGELRLLYEDEHVVALDKPPGLSMHPGAGRDTGTLAHRLLGRFPEMAVVGGPGRPGIVHRLDLGTSGVVIAARTPKAYQELSRAFAERRVDKRYLAVAYGSPREVEGRIEVPLGRHPSRRKEMAVRNSGRPSLTLYRTLAGAPFGSLMELDLRTGRTHQIRIHLKHLGNPLVGDAVYGEKRWKGLPQGPQQRALRDFPRPALHAWRLRLKHPTTGAPLALEAPVPEDLWRLWEAADGVWPARVLAAAGTI